MMRHTEPRTFFFRLKSISSSALWVADLWPGYGGPLTPWQSARNYAGAAVRGRGDRLHARLGEVSFLLGESATSRCVAVIAGLAVWCAPVNHHTAGQTESVPWPCAGECRSSGAAAGNARWCFSRGATCRRRAPRSMPSSIYRFESTPSSASSSTR